MENTRAEAANASALAVMVAADAESEIKDGYTLA